MTSRADASPSPLRALAIGGSLSLLGAAATAVFGLVRLKGLAVYLGPSGLGVYGQLWTFVLYAGTFSALGIGVGTTKIAARERERRDVDAVDAVSWLAIALPIAVGTVMLVLTLALASGLAPLLLGSDRTDLIVLACLSIPFVGLQATLQALVQGFEDARGQAVIYALYGASFTALSVIGALVAGVRGAVIALTLGNLILGALYVARTRMLVHRAGGTVPLRPRAAFQLRALLRALLPIGAGALLGIVVFSIADVAVRTALLHGSGKSTAGLWFGLMSISLQFIALLLTAITYITAPLAARAAAREDASAIRRVLDDSLRLTILVVVPVIGLIVALRHQVVTVLFSDDFESMAHYVPAQMAGDLMRSLAWTLGAALVPLGMTAVWVTIGVAPMTLYGIVGTTLALRWGLGGAVTAYVLLWSITAALTITVLVRRKIWSPSRRVATGLVLAVAVFAAAVVLPQPAAVATVLILSVALLIAITSQRERASARTWLGGLLGRPRPAVRDAEIP